MTRFVAWITPTGGAAVRQELMAENLALARLAIRLSAFARYPHGFTFEVRAL